MAFTWHGYSILENSSNVDMSSWLYRPVSSSTSPPSILFSLSVFGLEVARCSVRFPEPYKLLHPPSLYCHQLWWWTGPVYTGFPLATAQATLLNPHFICKRLVSYCSSLDSALNRRELFCVCETGICCWRPFVLISEALFRVHACATV